MDRIKINFYWPCMNNSVSEYKKSCEICQKTISKGRVGIAPLGKIPTVSVPFEKIAIDLIGPIFMRTDRGHKWILTIVDFATRYPEAIPLKNITSSDIAEALLGLFSRVGIPKTMNEVCRLLNLEQTFSSPYHPKANIMR